MAGPTGYPDIAGDVGGGSDRAPATASPTRTPLWVWVVGIVVVGSALAMIVSMTVPLLLGGMSGGGH
jgi:hypothetical protein